MNDEVTVYPIPIIPKKIPNQLPPRLSNRWRNLSQKVATFDNIEEFVELINGSAPPASKKKGVAAKGNSSPQLVLFLISSINFERAFLGFFSHRPYVS